MTLVASGRFMNWSSVAFTPDGGVAIPIKEVQDVQIDPRITFRGASGDGDMTPSAKTVEYVDPRITVRTEDLKTINTIGWGAAGTLTATHNDFMNKAGTGAMTYTITGCIAAPAARGGAHRQTGTGTIEFETYSSDGVTSPISVSYAA